MSGHDDFLGWYALNRRMYLWIWAGFCALAVAFWLFNVMPFAVGRVVSTGQIIEQHCGSKDSTYTYSYEVNGTRYEGSSVSVEFDGNGPCRKLVPGTEIPITYRAALPWKSMGGTVFSWTRGLMTILLGLTVLCLGIVPFIFYIRYRLE